MDGWQFIASVIASLAWPSTVLVVLWYNRVRLSNLFSNLPDWIEELTLPGGTKIRFSKVVEKAAETAQLIGPEQKEPEASTVEFRFHEPREFVGLLTLATKARDPQSVIAELARLGFIKPESIELFNILRDGYRSAVREGYGRVEESDARSYRNSALTLINELREALPRVEEINPRKQAGWAYSLPKSRR